MNLCSDGHDEVCYEGRKCPACFEIEIKKDAINGLDNLSKRLERDLADAEARIAELESDMESFRMLALKAAASEQSE